MALVQACMQGEASIRRARSLFADPEPTTAPTEAAQSLTVGADTAVAAGQRTSDLSGAGIDAYQQFVNTSTPALTTAASNDLTLGSHLDAAAAITRGGATVLDAIAQQAAVTTQAAATANTPAAQRAVLAVMQTHVQAADNVVESTRSQAANVAAAVKAIDYKQGPPGMGHDDFDLDTQFSRPQGVMGGPLPQMVADPNLISPYVATMTATIAWLCAASQSCASKICK